MKVQFTIDRSESSFKKTDAITRVNREMGSRASISGDVITVDSFDESKVVAILQRADVDYSRNS